MKILLVGSNAREHAIAKAVKKSKNSPELYCYASNNNPGIKELSEKFVVGDLSDTSAIVDFAKTNEVGLAIVGPEKPLEAGVPDVLWENNIPCVGPHKELSQIETSKGFARDLMVEHGGQDCCPRYKKFASMQGVKEMLEELGENYVIKADGLMGGKGVKVSGDHLHNHDEAVNYCQELVAANKMFLIEEKLIGQEFSLMSFCDGEHLVHMPAVQDHKRAFDGDQGPNTGGVGSYSDSNHSLPFLTDEEIQKAKAINELTAKALKEKFNQEYKGILYGGFIATKNGVKLIEYNARFGDPESMNVLAVLESDFVELCQAIINGNLRQERAVFAPKATVCKYAVPTGYPDEPVKNQEIDIGEVQNKEQLYLASVEEKDGKLYELGSRAVAFVGVAETIEEAEKQAEEEIEKIKGPLFHRKDIGTKELIERRVKMMKELR